MDRTILHCDMNGFFASVELLDHPELIHRPMAVCGNPDNRHGIILAKNQIAKEYGVTTAETLWQARKKCPDLCCVPPHMHKYKHYSQVINEIYNRYTDMVEPFSIDESWLDVTASMNLFGSGKDIADAIRETVKKETGLTLSAGVSFNKIFAKMGSEYKKPDATTVISRENYKHILWPLPVSQLFFVGKVSAEKLKKSGIHTIGALALCEKSFLVALLGKQGSLIHDYANGRDMEPVAKFSQLRKARSIGNGITFKRNLLGQEDIRIAVVGLSDKIAARLRKEKLKASGIKIEIKDPGFQVISRQKQLPYASNISGELINAAMELIQGHWDMEKPIRLLTITAINLCDETEEEQLSLVSFLSEDREKSEKIDRTLDSIREKYGNKAISFGRVLNNDIGMTPDHRDEEE
ncbi:MAG: DNA polymerase IV [Anaerovoracaceae bacterium]